MAQTRFSNDMLCAFEYHRRIEELRGDGFRLSFDSSKQRGASVWCALLVHHNGKRVRLTCRLNEKRVIQKTNDVVVYDRVL